MRNAFLSSFIIAIAIAGCNGSVAPVAGNRTLQNAALRERMRTTAVSPDTKVIFNLLYQFGSALNVGFNPYGGLYVDAQNDIFGTSTNGSQAQGNGSVFEIPHSGRTTIPLYAFQGNQSGDGAFPYGQLTADSQGDLYGTTSAGGGTNCPHPAGCGTVYRLVPNPSGSPTYSILYRFQGAQATPTPDGQYPYAGVILDSNTQLLWGTTYRGGQYDMGTVFALAPSGSVYTEVYRYDFAGGSDGSFPAGGLVEDKNGNFFGTAMQGGYSAPPCPSNGCGTIFEISPSGNTYTFSPIHEFCSACGTTLRNDNDGAFPWDAPIIDGSGNLYGTTQGGGEGESFNGTVWELPPPYVGQGSKILHAFPSSATDGEAPQTPLLLFNGQLYGTAFSHGTGKCNYKNYPKGCGTIFSLNTDGTGYSTVHNFTGTKKPYGAYSYAGVTAYKSNRLVGVTYYGGPKAVCHTNGQATGCGVLYELKLLPGR